MATPYKLLFIFGTRPEAIKLAPVVKEAVRNPAFRVETCATAQHRELLDQMLQVFEIAPGYDLDLMKDDQSLFGLTGDAIVAIENVLAEVTPDLVIVQGDTTTTMVAALGAFYRKVPVAHVEAGLRTHETYAPFPEEVNRRIVSVVSELNFAPTEWARDNLLREGIRKDRIFVVGNTVVDAALQIAATLDAAGAVGLGGAAGSRRKRRSSGSRSWYSGTCPSGPKGAGLMSPGSSGRRRRRSSVTRERCSMTRRSMRGWRRLRARTETARRVAGS